jgi:hypothetical protein
VHRAINFCSATTMDTVIEQVGKLKDSIDAEVKRLADQQAAFDTERKNFELYKAKIATIHVPSTIKLDVGGQQFKTSVATLRKEESMLSAMFSGSGFKVEKDEDGYFFIDRPGAPFAFILHYLQTGVLVPPTDPSQLKALKLEADFYQVCLPLLSS